MIKLRAIAGGAKFTPLLSTHALPENSEYPSKKVRILPRESAARAIRKESHPWKGGSVKSEAVREIVASPDPPLRLAVRS